MTEFSWVTVSPYWNFKARDKNGALLVHHNKPVPVGNRWESNPAPLPINGFAVNGCEVWRETLQERPDAKR